MLSPTSRFQPLVYSFVGNAEALEKNRRNEGEGEKLDNLGVGRDKDCRPFILIREATDSSGSPRSAILSALLSPFHWSSMIDVSTRKRGKLHLLDGRCLGKEEKGGLAESSHDRDAWFFQRYAASAYAYRHARSSNIRCVVHPCSKSLEITKLGRLNGHERACGNLYVDMSIIVSQNKRPINLTSASTENIKGILRLLTGSVSIFFFSHSFLCHFPASIVPR